MQRRADVSMVSYRRFPFYGDKDDPEFEVEMSAIYDEMEAQA